MDILFFHRWVGVHKGGAETHIRELADRFQKLGHEITIFTREGDELFDFNPRVRVVRVSKNPAEYDHSYEDFRVYIHTLFFMLKSLFKLILMLFKGEYFDVISVHFFTEAWVAKIYNFFRRTPIIFILEGYTPFEAKAAKLANKRITISLFEANKYLNNYSVESKVIPVGIDIARFSIPKEQTKELRRNLATDDEKIALTVCRLEPRKDIPTLIKAVKYAKDRLKAVKFVIVGDGISRREIEVEILSQGLNNKIFLTGKVSESELPQHYACADFFVLPTRQEWFGIVFLEAMASGLPIITTDVDACPEVVGDCGIYFKPGDYVTLAKHIIELANNNEFAQCLSMKTRERVRRFEWDIVIKDYEKEYISVVKQD